MSKHLLFLTVRIVLLSVGCSSTHLQSTAINLEPLTITPTASSEQRLGENAILQKDFATNLYQDALAEQDETKMQAAKAAFRKAAESFRAYLANEDHQNDRYAFRFFLGEMLYRSDQFQQAAKEYAKVRDDESPSAKVHSQSAVIREEAGFGAIKAVERHLETLVAGGLAPERVLALAAVAPTKDPNKWPSTQPVRRQPEDLPSAANEWAEHTDRYITLGLKHPSNRDFAVQQLYRIGLLFYNFRDYNEARKRWEQAMANWPRTDEASYSARMIINSYKDESDWANVEKWTDQLLEKALGNPKMAARMESAVKLFKLGVVFHRAEMLFAEKQFRAAGQAFERVIRTDPKVSFSDKALFNAGLSYQLGKYWHDARQTFETIITDPRFAKSAVRVDAMTNLANAFEQVALLSKAIQTFQTLLNEFPTSEHAPYATFRIAELLAKGGQLREAAHAYEHYADQYKARNDAIVGSYRAGQIYGMMKDANAEIRHWRTFIRRYSATTGADTRIVEANRRLGDLFKAQKEWKTAKRYYERAIKEFRARSLATGEQAEHAARAQFELTDEAYRAYLRLRLRKGMSLARQQNVVRLKYKAMVGLAHEVTGHYIKIAQYRYDPMSVAVFVRMAQVSLDFSKMLQEAPDPKGLNQEEFDLYRNELEAVATRLERFAIEQLEEAVAATRRLHIDNEWSQLAVMILTQHNPGKAPLTPDVNEPGGPKDNEDPRLAPAPTLGSVRSEAIERRSERRGLAQGSKSDGTRLQSAQCGQDDASMVSSCEPKTVPSHSSHSDRT